MPSPRGCALLFGLAALACGSGGAGGDDLFNVSGGSSVASGGRANGVGGSGGTNPANGGAASGGIDSAAGGATNLGGSSPTASGGASGGTVTTNGGAPSASGGRSGSAGALTSGGAGAANGGAGTAGAGSGGAPVITGGAGGAPAGGRIGSGGQVGAGGQVGNGGQQGTGGKTGASCDMLRMRLETLLSDAQACERTGGSGFVKCSETVMTECGCSVPVNEASTNAIEEYKSALTQVKKVCGTPNCPKIACQAPIPATCQGSGPGMGHCAPSSFDTGQGRP